MPNSDLLAKNFPSALDAKKRVKVNEFFLIEGSQNIFAIGDVTALDEEKLGERSAIFPILFPSILFPPFSNSFLRAYEHAKLVVEHIKRMQKGKPAITPYKVCLFLSLFDIGFPLSLLGCNLGYEET